MINVLSTIINLLIAIVKLATEVVGFISKSSQKSKEKTAKLQLDGKSKTKNR